MYRRRKLIQEEKPPIPDKLEDFGYRLKENGEIRSISLDEPYEFDYLPKDRSYNEKRYDKLIDIIGDEVEKRLQAEPYHYQKVYLPKGVDPEKEVHSYFYMTPNALTTTGKLLIMIPNNATRVGQWSKRVMCDQNIKTGSMMQITELVKEKGYEAIILNSNGNFWHDGRAQSTFPPHASTITEIPGSETPEKHCQYVFHHFIKNAKAEKIAVIAMGWGGHCFTLTLNNEFDFIKDRVKVIAMTDSAHGSDMIEGSDKRAFMFDNCINWIVNAKAKGELVQDARFGCTCISSALEISDFTMTEMLDDILKFVFVKMGDIEPEPENDEEDDETFLLNEAKRLEIEDP
ncbi:uncharacterized protein B0P05DRAFT_560366 [Gilbertella persicaria]|uniref:uncharacterized protein n=1 Tax=Gilbertella persicaria TaxID=101096 RepID=UPI00221F84DF|nr:uncharacterized protein B0P05DRAFT_560366 [Gilbertella persicaria]KAI8056303.1 hypothetical protein B0P05DRAFT_560366 [Gilbertella persicaria]